MPSTHGPRSCDSRSRSLRCSPADFDLGSDRGYRDGWCDESTFRIVDINSFCWLWCLWVCGRRRAFPRFPSWLGKRGKHSRSAKPIVHISTGLPRKLVAACDSRGSGADAHHCTTRPHNTQKTEELELLYPWHPWLGRQVLFSHVI